jgi:DNA-binding HxlR family transcriptional regulator
MPTLMQPDLPGDVMRAIETLGSRARVEILHLLQTRGALSTAEIHEATPFQPAARRSLQLHLDALEREGFIVGTPGAGHRGGRLVTWEINAAAVRSALDTLASYVAGPSPS